MSLNRKSKGTKREKHSREGIDALITSDHESWDSEIADRATEFFRLKQGVVGYKIIDIITIP